MWPGSKQGSKTKIIPQIWHSSFDTTQKRIFWQNVNFQKYVPNLKKIEPNKTMTIFRRNEDKFWDQKNHIKLSLGFS